jgi:hypothetical protein
MSIRDETLDVDMMVACIKRCGVFPHGFSTQQMSTLPYSGMRLADVRGVDLFKFLGTKNK